MIDHRLGWEWRAYIVGKEGHPKIIGTHGKVVRMEGSQTMNIEVLEDFGRQSV